MLIDKLIITVKPGSGGKGIVSFNKDSNNPRGGPDGGSGGKGGDILLKFNSNLTDLSNYSFSRFFEAEDGGDGGKQNRSGGKGKDLFINLPTGCLVWEIRNEKRQLMYFMNDATDLFQVYKGGKGGKGNVSYVTSKNKEPLLAEFGEKAESHTLELDLRLISDVCLLGYPNVGKSTFISLVSNASPEIKNYPFTTKEPVIAINKSNYGNIKIIEIPGISQKKGIGVEYLKHLHGAKILCLTVDATLNIDLQINDLMSTINDYDSDLSTNKEVVVLATKSEHLTKKDKTSIAAGIRKRYKPIKDKIEDIKTATLWKKKKSTFEPDYCAVRLKSDPWIVQPFEHYEEIRIEELENKHKKKG